MHNARALFMDARADLIHADSLNLQYMRVEKPKNSAARDMDRSGQLQRLNSHGLF